MKRSKKVICMALTLALSAGLLAGCGGQTAAPAETNSGGRETGGGAQTAAPEYVYVAESVPVASFGDGNQSISGATWYGDSFYVYASDVVADNTPEGVTPEYPGQYLVYAPALYRIGLDGKDVERVYLAEPPEDEDSNVNLAGYGVGPDGNLIVLEQFSRWWNDAPEGLSDMDEDYWQYYRSSQRYVLKTLDGDGNTLSEAVPAGLNGDSEEDGENLYVNGFAVGGDGAVYLASEQKVYALDKSGETLFDIELPGWGEKLVAFPDGGVACLYWGDSGEEIALIDPETKALSEGQQFSGSGYAAFAGGGEYDLCYTSGINLYGYSLESGEAVKLLNWLDCDVDPENGSGAAILDDGRIVLSYTSWDSDYEHPENELIILEKKPYDSVPHKETITLATQSLDYEMRGKIVDFNRKNEQYRIEVRDYSEYNDYTSENEEDWNAGLTRLKTEIGAGTLPDILDLSGLPMEQLAAKGFLEDLYAFLDADASLSREDLLPNVLEALEVDGKLYTPCPFFSVVCVMGSARVVGDTPGWTYDDFNAALREMPEGCTAFDQYVTRDDMLRTCLALDGDSFVNWATGECSFDSEAFIKLLEFVKSFPGEFDWENYEWSEDEEMWSRISSGRQMLAQTSVYDFYDQKMYQAMFGGDAVYIGFPTASGTGNMIQPASAGYAITSQCSDKDAAWAFLRQMFTENDSNIYSYGLPLNRAAFEKKLKEAMTPTYETDINGEFLLDENGDKIEIDYGSWSWGSLEIPNGPMTQEEADLLLDAINTTTKLYKFDESIYDIVSEQAEAFFDGQKTAAEAAKLIQSKAMIYVNEQR